MKRIIFIALVFGFLLVSCGKREEKEAVECLKAELGIPTSFNIISVDVTNVRDTIVYDTLYHVSSVDSALGFLCDVCCFVNVHTFSYDSIEVFESSYYPATVYHIKYEIASASGVKQGEGRVYSANGSYSADLEVAVKCEKEFVGKEALAGSIDMNPKSIGQMNVESWFNVLHYKGEVFARSEYSYFESSPDYMICEGGYAPTLAVKDEEVDEDYVYDFVEELPEYPGGDEAFEKYVSKNIHYPEKAREMGIQGRVICKFTVRKDGSIEDVVVLRGSDPALYSEAIRLVFEMPKWKPGKMKGQVVNCCRVELIEFKL